MNGTTQVIHGPEKEAEKKSLFAIMSGSFAEGIAGIAASIIAIVGLSGMMPERMLFISTIAVGAALLFQGVAVAVRFSHLVSETSKSKLDVAELGLGMSAESIGGAVGVVLGILFFTTNLIVLPAIASIIFGISVIFGSGLTIRLNSLEIRRSGENEFMKELAHQAVWAVVGIQMVLGLTAVTLGIISLAGINPMILSLVAMLCVGISDFLSGTAIGSRIMSVFRK